MCAADGREGMARNRAACLPSRFTPRYNGGVCEPPELPAPRPIACCPCPKWRGGLLAVAAALAGLVASTAMLRPVGIALAGMVPPQPATPPSRPRPAPPIESLRLAEALLGARANDPARPPSESERRVLEQLVCTGARRDVPPAPVDKGLFAGQMTDRSSGPQGPRTGPGHDRTDGRHPPLPTVPILLRDYALGLLRDDGPRLRAAAAGLASMADSWAAQGCMDQALMAYASAARVLDDAAASPQLVPLVAEEAPAIYRRLAAALHRNGDRSQAAKCEYAAAQWDRLYDEWRKAADGPPNLLPNTGSGVFFPREHRRAMLALSRCGIASYGVLFYGVGLSTAGVSGLVVWSVRRVRRSPHRQSLPAPPSGLGRIIAFPSGARVMPVVACLTALPTAIGVGALHVLAGEDWAWVFSVRLLVAAALLLLLGHGWSMGLSIRVALRSPPAGHDPAAAAPRWRAHLFEAIVLLLMAMILAALVPGGPHRAIVPRRVDMVTSLAPALWLVVGLRCLGGILLPGLRRTLWRIPKPPHDKPARQGRTGAWWFSHSRGVAWRRKCVLGVMATGLAVHALLLPGTLWLNQRAFIIHARAIAPALADEPTHRLGSEWRARYGFRGAGVDCVTAAPSVSRPATAASR